MNAREIRAFLGQKSLKMLGVSMLAAFIAPMNVFSALPNATEARTDVAKSVEQSQEKQLGVLGIVLDGESKQPLSGAMVMVDGVGVGTISLSNGYFIIYVKQGMKLHISAEGFYPAIVEVNEEMMNLQVMLQKDSSPVINKDTSPVLDAKEVDEQASFPGGSSACAEFISKNLHYPQIAVDNGISGRIFVECIVNADGSLTDVKVAKGHDPYLNKEAVRLVKLMPKWNPAKKDGKPVRVKTVIPVDFKL